MINGFSKKKRLKAILYEKYGGPGELSIKELDPPIPKDNEVLVKVYAVSLNDWDLGLLSGDFVNRMLNGIPGPKKKILCSDIAGVVATVGKDVRLFKPGDEVYGDLSGQWGGLAEYVCASEKSLAKKPASMSFVEAAAIPQAAMLAVQALIDKGKIQSNHKLLVNGAGGGVGSFAVQIAKLYRAEITGVDSNGKLDMLRSIGFDHVVDYTKQDFTKSGQLYDLIIDAKTNRPVSDYIRALSPNGRYVTVGGSLGRLFQVLLFSPWISMLGKKKFSIVSLKPNKDLDYMNKLFENGDLKPLIEGPYHFSQFREAFEIFIGSRHKGKVVIVM